MDNRKQILINHIQQKFLRIATSARIKDEDGKSFETEMSCLTKLHALLIFISDKQDPTYEELRKAELLAFNICGRTHFPYKPMDWSFMEFETVEAGTGIDMPISACDITYTHESNFADANTVCSYLDYLMGHITYEHPWVNLTVMNGYAPGKYEVGSPDILTEIAVTVNKLALSKYFIKFLDETTEHERELKDNLPRQFVPLGFQSASIKKFELKAFYRDLQKHKGQNILAEKTLVWESAWPCYYGTGPANAMDNPDNRNAFMQSLNKGFECPQCFDAVIPEGHVFWYFYPFDKAREFKTENGTMIGSFKGTFQGRTKSMDDHNVSGSQEYGVVRTSTEGIGCIKICIIEHKVCSPYETDDPIYEDPIEEAPEISIEGVWSDEVCVKETTNDPIV